MGFRERLTALTICVLIFCLGFIVREQNRIKQCMETGFIKVFENAGKANAEISIHHMTRKNNQSETHFQVLSGSLHVRLSHDSPEIVQSESDKPWDDTPVSEAPITERYDSTPEGVTEPFRKKVLLFAYMKGGSTFAGQLFNQYPNSMYFYEPIGGFYSSLYGSPDWAFPLELLLNSNGSFRSISKHEQHSIIHNTKKLYNCDIPHLPLEFLQHQGLWLSSSSYEYRRCLQNAMKAKLGANSTFKDRLMFKVEKLCPNSAQVCIENGCDVFMNLTRNADEPSPASSTASSLKMHKSLQNETLLKEFRYLRKQYKEGIQKCIGKLHVPCVVSQLMVVKALRLTMDTVRVLLRDDPHLKLVYLVRDPRGILVSRRRVQYLSDVFEPNIQSETLLLCPKMARDLEGYLTLRSEFPDRVLQLRYEDTADHPQETVNKVYKFIGLPPSASIKEWVEVNTQAASDGDQFSTQRANSSATAHAWRAKIKPGLKAQMDLLCADVIRQLGYTL